MSHLIIEPYDTVYTPKGSEWEETWHRLQTAVPGGIARDGSNVERVFRPICEAGFKPDFSAEISNVPDELQSELNNNPITDWKVLLADLRDNGQGIIPIHVCKRGYMVHQNKALFDAMVGAAREVLGNDGFEIATVGTLGAFSQFFASIAIKGNSESFTVANGDVWKLFFNLVSSHNSLVASQIMQSAIRMVCMNTVQMSIHNAGTEGTAARIKHTANSGELIDAKSFASHLAKWQKRNDEMKKALLAMRAMPMDLTTFRAFAAGVFTNEGSDCLSTTSYNRVEEMVSLFQRGRGNKGESLYDGINAFTEYFTSGNGVGNPNRVKASKRFASANFGRGNEWKLEAMRVAGDEGELAATMKRGERMYGEYAKN